MSIYDIGDVATLDFTVALDDVLTNPTTTTLTITDPNGNVTTPTPTHVSVGTYTHDQAVTVAGTWTYTWVTAGTVATAQSGTFTAQATGSTARPLQVTAIDLGVYMDDTAIDTARADLMLTLAANACTSVLSPLTDNARGIVLAVAARAYDNPSGLASETIGGYSARWSGAGIFLTADERSELLGLRGIPRNRSVVLQLPA